MKQKLFEMIQVTVWLHAVIQKRKRAPKLGYFDRVPGLPSYRRGPAWSVIYTISLIMYIPHYDGQHYDVQGYSLK